jgi:hypothetical protein
MPLTHWQVKFLYNTGDLISAWKFNQEHQQIYDALNFLQDNKLHLDGSQAMTGNLMIAKALAGILFKNADNDICRIVVGSQEINITANADTSDGTTWNRDDVNKPSFRLRLFYKDGTTQTALIFYSAEAGSNPITWTEQWRINSDGTNTLVLASSIITAQDYETSSLSLIANSWNTIASINLNFTKPAKVKIEAYGTISVGATAGTMQIVVRDTTTVPPTGIVASQISLPTNTYVNFSLSGILSISAAGARSYDLCVYPSVNVTALQRNLNLFGVY